MVKITLFINRDPFPVILETNREKQNVFVNYFIPIT